MGTLGRLSHRELELVSQVKSLSQVGLRAHRDHIVVFVDVEELDGALLEVAEGGSCPVHQLLVVPIQGNSLGVAIEAHLGDGRGVRSC